SAQVSASRVRISWFSSLSRSGRFMRTTRTCPCSSVSTAAMAGSPDISWALGDRGGARLASLPCRSNRAGNAGAGAGRSDRGGGYRRIMDFSAGDLAALAIAVLAAGIVTGLLAGLFGIGGGAVIVPVLLGVV